MRASAERNTLQGEITMPFYERGNVRIHYEEVGSGFPLMIIPGGGLNSTVAGLATQGFLIKKSGSLKSQLTVSANPLAVVGWRCKPESL
jgi:hypothetical protein